MLPGADSLSWHLWSHCHHLSTSKLNSCCFWLLPRLRLKNDLLQCYWKIFLVLGDCKNLSKSFPEMVLYRCLDFYEFSVCRSQQLLVICRIGIGMEQISTFLSGLKTWYPCPQIFHQNSSVFPAGFFRVNTKFFCEGFCTGCKPSFEVESKSVDFRIPKWSLTI